MLNTPLLRKAWESVLPALQNDRERFGDLLIGKMRLTDFSEYVYPLIDSILDGSRRIQRIVTDLKDYARPDPYDLNREIDIAQVIRSAVNLMHNAIVKKSIACLLMTDEERFPVKGSFQRLEQVIINLLQNACDAITARDQTITITLKKSTPDSIIISISDTGCGIAPSDLPHITEPFFTTKRGSGGTGLGLSVSSKIVTDHCGKLRFESQVGKGTTVDLVLPRRKYENAS
jgi:signal transduction histidine kinase